jgi:hypothetical protein
MAYFSNGSEGMMFDDECAECELDYCPILLAHTLYNYDQVNNPIARNILNLLVEQKDGKYIGCQMKPLIDKMKGSEE